MLYCIEVYRESEEVCILHEKFETEPTREEVLAFVMDQDLNYDDNYGKITFNRVG